MTDKPTLTPAACGVAAEKAISDYIQAVGAYGEQEKVRKAMEMLVSKCALGLGVVTSAENVMTIMLRSTYNAAAILGKRDTDAAKGKMQ